MSAHLPTCRHSSADALERLMPYIALGIFRLERGPNVQAVHVQLRITPVIVGLTFF